MAMTDSKCFGGLSHVNSSNVFCRNAESSFTCSLEVVETQSNELPFLTDSFESECDMSNT